MLGAQRSLLQGRAWEVLHMAWGGAGQESLGAQEGHQQKGAGTGEGRAAGVLLRRGRGLGPRAHHALPPHPQQPRQPQRHLQVELLLVEEAEVAPEGLLPHLFGEGPFLGRADLPFLQQLQVTVPLRQLGNALQRTPSSGLQAQQSPRWLVLGCAPSTIPPGCSRTWTLSSQRD